MKIRIKGNSIRLRLTKTDVRNLKENGRVDEKTVLGKEQLFSYSLLKDENADAISAAFVNGNITVVLPKNQSEILTETDEITVKGYQNNGEEGGLFLLIEKDLQCLDDTFEDQSDMYENPNTTC